MKIDKTNPYNQNAKKSYSKKTLILVSLLTAIFLLVNIKCTGGKSTIGKYTKEELPKDFTYTITKDESDVSSEKNQLEIELNQKLTIGQIATLAEDLFETKDEQRRFYISYKLKNVEYSSINWANSDFDPELKIQINGSTAEEDLIMLEKAKKIKGNIIGVFNEQGFTDAFYVIYQLGDKTVLDIITKNSQQSKIELIETKLENKTRYNYSNGSYNGEYFILTKENNLEFYNNKDEKFTMAHIVKLK